MAQIEFELDGVMLTRVGSSEKGDLWAPTWGDWDGPSKSATLDEWPEIIREWRVKSQIDAGFEIWNLEDDRPKYWGKQPAVFRSGAARVSPMVVHTRNGTNPSSLYPIKMQDCAPVTDEVEKAIEHARGMHAKAIKARDAWHAAKKAIPRIEEPQFMGLPEKDG